MSLRVLARGASWNRSPMRSKSSPYRATSRRSSRSTFRVSRSATTSPSPTEITDEEMEAAGIVEEPSDEAAEEVEAEEETEEVSPDEGEGPAGQNLQP